MSYGTAFQLIWNNVPDDMEHGSSLVLIRRDLK